MDWSQLLPAVDRAYRGPKPPFYFLVFVAIVGTIRSLIHIFAPDGGANVIAGINIEVQGGANIVALFGQWGAMQLMLALLYWVVIFRYRFLVPLMLAFVVLEQFWRLLAGVLKPLEVTSPPPGAIGSQVLLPLAVLALIWSLLGSKERAQTN